MVYYTSATSCFIPKARVLGKSLKKYNPTAKFFLLLSDELPDDFCLENEPFDGVLKSSEIELNCDMSVPFWFYLHDVTELCTAVKGWAALELLERTGEDKIVYLDPDIAVFHSMDPLEKMLDEHDIIITPHRLAPEPRYDACFYGDHQLYTRGVYNLGFVAVKKTEQGIAFLQWWRKMLETLCYVDDPNGLFTDQKLIDLAPAFFEKLYICRDEGYNISWWNITQRTISGTVDDLRVNGKPVYFYHFSNYDSGLHKQVVIDHCGDNQALLDLYDWYTEQQNENGYMTLRKYPCIYNTYDNGEPITATARQQSRKRSDIMNGYRHSDPYKTEGRDSLYRYYKMYFPEYMYGWQGCDKKESDPVESEYYEEYLAVVSSRSYRFGRKVMDTANAILPAGSKRRMFFGKCWRLLRCMIVFLCKYFTFGENSYWKKRRKKVVIENLAIQAAEAPAFSVFIPDATCFRNVYQSIKSLCLAALPKNGIEVFVSGALPASDIRKLEKTIQGVTLLTGANFADEITKASGKYVLLFGENLSVQPDFFAKAEDRMEETGAAIVQCQVCFQGDNIFEAGGVVTQSGQRISYGFGFQKSWGSVRYYKSVDCVSLYGSIIEKQALEQVGGVDKSFQPLYQMADLSFALRKQGRETIFVPDLTILDQRAIQDVQMPSDVGNDAIRFAQKWETTLLAENIATEEELFLGRDRAKGRKTVFAVDDRIPCYDESAGDRTTYHYYVTMAEMGYNLKIVGDEMRRREPYATQLEKLGIEIVSADGSGDREWQDFLQRFGKYIDVAYLNRPHILEKYYEAVKKYTDAKIIYYCMDLHFLRETRECILRNDVEGLKHMQEKEKGELAKTDLADVVLTLSTYEKDLLESKLSHAKVVLNPVFVYRDFPVINTDFKTRKDIIFVGGFGHTPNVDAAKWICNEIMPLINRVYPELRLHLVGSNPPAEVKALASKNVICHGFLQDDELIKLYNQCRISVVPLRYGAGIKGKVLEAMYNGLPIVSTSVGTEGIIDIERYIEDTDEADEFARKVIELYDDTDRLAAMSRNNQQYVKDHLSVESAQKFFREIF